MRWILSLGLFWASSIFGQAVHYVRSSLNAPLVVTSRFSDALTVSQQPAALAQLNTAGGVVASEAAFGLKELNSISLSFNTPLLHSGISVTIDSHGNTDFRESRLSLSYGRLLGKLAIGAQFNYTHINASGYGTAHALSAGVGLCWWLSPRLGIGILVTDPGGIGLDKIYEKLAWTYRTGICYELSEKVLLLATVVKKEALKAFIETGLIYKWQERFYFRAGIKEVTGSPYISSGWCWKSLRLECSASLHQQLGISPGLLLLFNTPKKVL